MVDVDEAKLRPWLTLVRTVVLFAVGIGGVIHETVFSHAERPTLLVLYAAMIGLPFAIKADQGTREAKKPDTRTDEVRDG